MTEEDRDFWYSEKFLQVIKKALLDKIELLELLEQENERLKADLDVAQKMHLPEATSSAVNSLLASQGAFTESEKMRIQSEYQNGNLRTALEKAVQLCDICSDWNLDEVQIDGVMVKIYELKAEFEDTLKEGAADGL